MPFWICWQTFFAGLIFINELYRVIHLYQCTRIPISLHPDSIFKIFAFVSSIGHFKDSSQRWSVQMLCELLQYFQKYDLEVVFARHYLWNIWNCCFKNGFFYVIWVSAQKENSICFHVCTFVSMHVYTCMWPCRQAELRHQAYTVSLEVLQLPVSHSEIVHWIDNVRRWLVTSGCWAWPVKG